MPGDRCCSPKASTAKKCDSGKSKGQILSQLQSFPLLFPESHFFAVPSEATIQKINDPRNPRDRCQSAADLFDFFAVPSEAMIPSPQSPAILLSPLLSVFICVYLWQKTLAILDSRLWTSDAFKNFRARPA
jgi:hypothetical protein